MQASIPSGQRLYWEDFPAGLELDCGSRSVGRDEIVAFACEFDPQPFHLDDEAGSASLFGGLSASGWHTCAMCMRMMCDSYVLRSSSLGSPGLDELRWLRPVRPGDVLQLRMTVLDARLMRSRPGVGLVRSRWDLRNQHGEPVLQMTGWSMFGTRQAAQSAAPSQVAAQARQP
jgi:acyl dehydratase